MRFLAVLFVCVFAFPLASYAAPPTCDAAHEGTIVYNKDQKLVQFCNATQWIGMVAKLGTGGSDTLAGLSCTSGQVPQWSGTAWGCGAGGTGLWADSGNGYLTYAGDKGVQLAQITGMALPQYSIGDFGCTANQILKWNGTAWACAADATGGSSVWADGGAGKIYYNGGNVGIGTISPTTALQVNGTVTANSISTSSFVAPTEQSFTSGSGTYTKPTSPRSPVYIRVRMVGGGGGGGGGNTGSGNGGAGGNTTFGSSLLTANGGGGGIGGFDTPVSAGGTASLGTGPVGIALKGATGNMPQIINVAGYALGGGGGVSPFGGAGPYSSWDTNGIAAIANTGSGGGGGAAYTPSSTQAAGGMGGGAGGYVDAIITSPAATYSYAVGAAGSGGSAGTNGEPGGAGGSGVIIVDEYYQ